MLIVYFSLPGALIASYFCQQSVNGQFDSLFSLPGSKTLPFLYKAKLIFSSISRRHNFLLSQCLDRDMLLCCDASNFIFIYLLCGGFEVYFLAYSNLEPVSSGYHLWSVDLLHHCIFYFLQLLSPSLSVLSSNELRLL